MELAALEHEWREEVARRYSFWPVLLGGTLVWIACLGLFALAWRRKRARSQATLERWDREEAGARLRAAPQPARIRIVFPERQPVAAAPLLAEVVPPPPPAELPRVEHEGDWHTMH
ncbi:MAG: hypothetical protein FJ104_15495, partial [Deltaproteobacteria bacterium]|nr:hypothetical protein [Deltaproteobacteria bacterium]